MAVSSTVLYGCWQCSSVELYLMGCIIVLPEKDVEEEEEDEIEMVEMEDDNEDEEEVVTKPLNTKEVSISSA